MIIIGHFLILLIMVEIDGLEQAINVKELTGFVGVKVPTKRVEISSWITDDKGLIVEAQPNNEMYAGWVEKANGKSGIMSCDDILSKTVEII
jgi:hypothetical protein